MDIVNKLEKWRKANGKVTWSMCGPDKRFPGNRFQITLYIYSSQHGRYLNEASKAGDTLEEAYESTMELWKERQKEK